MKKQLLILLALCIYKLGYSQNVGDTFIDSNITYEITSLATNRVKVIDYNTAGGTDVVIPNSVTPNASGRVSGSGNTNRMATYAITRIDNGAFASKGLTSVFIPSNVTSIGNSAFGNNDLNTVTIPNSVTSIGNQAFISNDFTSVFLGSGLVSIGGNAFDLNSTLTCVRSDATTPPSIFTGNGDTFGAANRSNISLIIPSGTTSTYMSNWTGFAAYNEGYDVNDTFWAGNIEYRVTSLANNTVSVADYNIAGGNTVNIPSTVTGSCTSEIFTVTAVDGFVFSSQPVNAVTFPNTILTIGQYAFQNCNLSSVTIPSSVNVIENRAFDSNSITTLNISNGLTTIGDYVFQDNLLTDITIPSSVTSIGNGAFRVNPLATVTSLATTPANVTTINGPDDTFDIGGDRSNIDLFIPLGTLGAYVTDPGALWTGFNSVTEQLAVGDPLVSDYISYEVISSSSSRMQNAVEVTDYDVLGGTIVSIPSTVTYNTITYQVTSIRNQAFQGKGLTDVTIPDSVTNIGSQAFSANPLTDVRSMATAPPTITTGTNDTFSSDRSTIHLHIPVGSSGVYVTDAGALWTGFNPVTEDATLSTTDFELVNEIKLITTANELKVISSGDTQFENYTIYSISGAKLLEGTESNIAIDALSNGIYVLEATFNKGKFVKKFVK